MDSNAIPEPVRRLGEVADELEACVVEWAAINSGSTHLAGLTRMAAALRDACLRLTDAVSLDRLDDAGRVVVRARCRPRAPRQVLLSGHYDTVYDAAHAFQSCERLPDGRLRGPGVADMKGGIVVMLAALSALERTPAAARLGWEILLTPDEETGSAASRAALTETARRHMLGLVFEPARASGALVRARMGTGSFSYTVHGRAAHAGGDPGAGRNAIVAASSLAIAAARLPGGIEGTLVNPGRIEGGGALNIVPDLARLELGVRARAVAGARTLEARLRTLPGELRGCDGCRVELDGAFDRPPFEATPATERLFVHWDACVADLGQTAPVRLDVAGGSDANLLAAAGLACLDGLGPVGGDLHSEREWIEAASLVPRAQVAALFLHRWACGDFEWQG